MRPDRSYRYRGTTDMPIGYYRIFNSHLVLNRWHPELEIVTVVSGTMTMDIGNTTKSFSTGDIFIIHPNEPHHLCSMSKRAKVHWLVIDPLALTMDPEHFFQKEFVAPLWEDRLELPAYLNKDHPAYETVIKHLQQLAQAEIYTDKFKSKRFSAALGICTALLPYCRVREEKRSFPLPNNEIASRCVRYIQLHYSEKLTLRKIAEECLVHPNYLCAVFKAHMGQTVMGWLNRTRVEAAAELLENQEIPIAKLMERTGFATEDTFRKNFLRYKGVTPREYRRKHRGEELNTASGSL